MANEAEVERVYHLNFIHERLVNEFDEQRSQRLRVLGNHSSQRVNNETPENSKTHQVYTISAIDEYR